jgi:hypothetical protein
MRFTSPTLIAVTWPEDELICMIVESELCQVTETPLIVCPN